MKYTNLDIANIKIETLEQQLAEAEAKLERIRIKSNYVDPPIPESNED